MDGQTINVNIKPSNPELELLRKQLESGDEAEFKLTFGSMVFAGKSHIDYLDVRRTGEVTVRFYVQMK